MATLFQIVQFFDENGNPLAGGKLNWYIAGTTTKKDTWIDQAESSPAPNPIILDNEGRVSIGQNGIWIRGSYKLVITDSNDNIVPGGTIDNINEYDQRDWTGLLATIADLNSTITTALSKNTTYTVAIDDRNKTILADATSSSFTINLPTAVSAGNKFRINIKKVDTSTNTVTIDPAGSETIDGRSTYILYDYNDTIRLQSDGSNWHIIASQIRGTAIIESSTRSLILDDNIKLVLANASGGSITLTLPVLSACGRGWRIKIKKVDSSTNPIIIDTAGAETIDGDSDFKLLIQYEAVTLITDGLNWYVENEYEGAAAGGLPRGYINGIIVESDSGDLDYDIKFNVGEARDYADTLNMVLSSSITKRIDANWVEGDNQGGFPSGLTRQNQIYHLFIIAKANGTVDAGFDEELDASNLLTDASDYSVYRRVGSIYVKADLKIDAFIATDFGDFREFSYNPFKRPVTHTSIGSGTHTYTDTIAELPSDIEVLARISGEMIFVSGPQTAASIISVMNPDITANNNAPLISSLPSQGAGETLVKSDDSQQIKSYVYVPTGTVIDYYIGLKGWIENLNVN